MNKSQYASDEPISSIATALAPAALGIVRVSGKDCINLVSKIFSAPKKLLAANGNSIVYGWIKDGTKIIDEVMIAVYKSPKSFTGEDMAEIFCHGGPSVITAIHNLLLKNGFRQAERGEYTLRAYMNGKMDLTKAEAVSEIIQSKTKDSESRAAERLAGSLYEEINSIKKLIIDTIATIEVEIEYPEDEETIADSFDCADIKKAMSRLESLVNSWKGEKLYQDGARVVLCGRTNAGKSSLFNAILKEERAIVSDIEGTTRDFLESWASFDGIPIKLFDTAGLRKTTDKIEAQGVEISKSLSKDADVVLYLIDVTEGMNEEDFEFLKNCDVPFIIVWNKCDKFMETKNTPSHKFMFNELKNFSQEIFVSAKSGEHLDNLYKGVIQIITSGISTEKVSAALGSERQKDAVAEALESVKHALLFAKDNYTLDAVVQDLEDALDSLSVVTGETTPDDILESIFSNFCVGK